MPSGGRSHHQSPLTVEVIQYVQEPELAAIPEAVGHEVHGPRQVWRLRRGQGIWLLTFQSLAGFAMAFSSLAASCRRRAENPLIRPVHIPRSHLRIRTAVLGGSGIDELQGARRLSL